MRALDIRCFINRVFAVSNSARRDLKLPRMVGAAIVPAFICLGYIHCPNVVAAGACLGQSQPRVVFVGDSLGAGDASWVWQLSKMCGWRDVQNDSVGSTGAIVAKPGRGNYVERVVTDVAPFNPSLVFITSYYNDRGHAIADIAAAFAETIDEIRAIPTHPLVIVAGTYDPAGVNLSPYAETDAALLAVCSERGVPYIEPRTGNVYDGSGRLVNLPNNAGPWITQANKGQFIADGVHETEAGESYIAQRMLDAIYALG